MNWKIVLAPIGILLLSLAGCVHMFPNPLSQMPSSQLRNVSDEQLCGVINNRHYTEDQNLYREMNRRGLKDCSSGELYCRNLELKKGTASYAQCRLSYDQMQVQVLGQEQQFLLQQQAQSQAIYSNMMQRNNVTCVGQQIGNGIYTNCN